jgi:hypothetical protein
VCFTPANIQAAGAGIAFSFFSTIIFGTLAFLGFRRWHQGDSSAGDDKQYLGAAEPGAFGEVGDYEPGAGSGLPYEPMQDSYEQAAKYDYDE